MTDGDHDLRGLLWRDHQLGLGFEDMLANLQSEFETKWTAQGEQDLRNLTSAVQKMFGSMGLAFSQTQFEPELPGPKLGVVRFLAKFDVIFTLNQDTLLEQKYIPIANHDIFPQSLQYPGYKGYTVQVLLTHMIPLILARWQIELRLCLLIALEMPLSERHGVRFSKPSRVETLLS